MPVSHIKKYGNNELAPAIECFCIAVGDQLKFRLEYLEPDANAMDLYHINTKTPPYSACLPWYDFSNAPNNASLAKLSECLIPSDSPKVNPTVPFFEDLGRCIALSWYFEDVDATRDNLIVQVNDQNQWVGCRRYDYDCAFASQQSPDSVANERFTKKKWVISNSEKNLDTIIDYYLGILMVDDTKFGLIDEDKLAGFKKAYADSNNNGCIKKGFLEQINKVIDLHESPHYTSIAETHLGKLPKKKRDDIEADLNARIETAKQLKRHTMTWQQMEEKIQHYHQQKGKWRKAAGIFKTKSNAAGRTATVAAIENFYHKNTQGGNLATPLNAEQVNELKQIIEREKNRRTAAHETHEFFSKNLLKRRLDNAGETSKLITELTELLTPKQSFL